MNRGQCKHCKHRNAARPRGLCYICYTLPGVREAYPALKTLRRGVEDGYGYRCMAPAGTVALPGTEEKIRVMEERASQGLNIWHPLDNSGDCK